MTKLTNVLRHSMLLSLLLAGSALAADDATLKKDMTSVIALQGQPCGEVVAVKVNAENDYTCTCKNGDRYRVYVNPTGRVVVEKQK
jgi:hypothetical protein